MDTAKLIENLQAKRLKNWAVIDANNGDVLELVPTSVHGANVARRIYAADKTTNPMVVLLELAPVGFTKKVF